MNIRKADSKGRITGFIPGAYYEVSLVPDANGVFAIVAQPLAPGGTVPGTGPLVRSTGCVIPGWPPPPMTDPEAFEPTERRGTVHEGEFHIPKGYEKGYD